MNHAVYTQSHTHLGCTVYKYIIHTYCVYRGISRVIHLCYKDFCLYFTRAWVENRTLQQKALRESSNSNQRLQYIYTIYIAKSLVH